MKKSNTLNKILLVGVSIILVSFSFSQQNNNLIVDESLSGRQKVLSTSENSLESSTFDFQVNKIFPPLSYTNEEVENAKTVSDINRYFKKSWIREYVSLEVVSIVNGKRETAIGKNEILTVEQKAIINKADKGSNIYVDVKYYPENNLSQNEVKTFDFSFTLDPAIDAQFVGGEDQLNQYLKEKAIDKIPEGFFVDYKFATVKFAIDEKGQVINPHVLWSSEDKDVDKLLLDAVCNMPVWQPAKFDDGTLLTQEFAFSVGNMENCASNLIHTKKLIWKEEDK